MCIPPKIKTILLILKSLNINLHIGNVQTMIGLYEIIPETLHICKKDL